jgi:ornithine cyclodeaminase
MRKQYEIVYLSQSDVEAAGLNMELALQGVETVLAMHGRDEVNLPSKVILDMDERRRGRINAMPGYIGGEFHICGIKWIAGFPGNPVKYGLPRANALLILNDADTGLPLAILEGTRISALRTGAVTGIGAKYLAKGNSGIIGMIGAGVQAHTQVDALMAVLPSINEIRIYDIRKESASELARHCQLRWEHLNLVHAESPQQAVEEADCIVTATVADEPIVKAAWLKEGVFFSHIGSYQEEEEEVIFQADKIVVDIWEEVLHRKTPLLARMFEAGKIDESRIHANIGDIICGRTPGRESDEERIFFSPLGLGSEDLAVGALTYKRAKEMNLGVKLPFGG